MHCYKYFDRKGHLENFLSGHIRFTSLEHYKNHSDQARQDGSEGEASYCPSGKQIIRINGSQLKVDGLKVTNSPVNPKCYFIMSMSLVEDLKKFGEYKIEISDLVEFCSQVEDQIREVFPIKIEFNHGVVNYFDTEILQNISAVDNVIFSKSDKYACEKEYRLCLSFESFQLNNFYQNSDGDDKIFQIKGNGSNMGILLNKEKYIEYIEFKFQLEQYLFNFTC